MSEPLTPDVPTPPTRSPVLRLFMPMTVGFIVIIAVLVGILYSTAHQLDAVNGQLAGQRNTAQKQRDTLGQNLDKVRRQVQELCKQQHRSPKKCAPAAPPAQKIVQGIPGTPGEPGSPGQSGKPGQQGNPGQPGQSGPPGQPGKNGQPGQNGTNPPCLAAPNQCNGQNGTNGQNGNDGPQGPQGPQGPAGPAGQDGKDGAQGPQGPAGPEPSSFTFTYLGVTYTCTDPDGDGQYTCS